MTATAISIVPRSPVLSQYGFSATMFLPNAYIGEKPVSFKGKDCLTWEEVRELKQHGVLFGSHTVTHPQLRELSAAAIHEEIANSKAAIEEKPWFCRGLVRLSLCLPSDGLRLHHHVA
jgi:hypothetical protein